MSDRLCKYIRTVFIVILLIMPLFGCQEREYSFEHGRYVPEDQKGKPYDGPFILTQHNSAQNSEHFVVVFMLAASDQPNGDIYRKKNEIVLDGEYMDEEYHYVFHLVDDNTLEYLKSRSSIPNKDAEWEDGIRLVLDR